mgnify:FL=1
MVKIAEAYKRWLGYIPPGVPQVIPTGSGETILCLQIAYPSCSFVAEYDSRSLSTTFSESAPLNKWVAASFRTIFR